MQDPTPISPDTAQKSASAIAIGQLLDGRYLTIAALASGGFAHTYLAEDTRLPGRPRCVVKHLNPTIRAEDDPSFARKARDLFQAEAETLQRLGRHDRIPQLYAYFEQEGEFYLVQEFVEGHPLSSELHPGTPLPESWAIKIVRDVLEILAFVHANDVIHRDIKPSNLLRRHRDSKLVLIDFGTVKQVSAQIAPDRANKYVTLPIGTPGYMSSEQERGDASPNNDIYALGMVALQVLTGTHPSQLPRTPQGEVLWRDRVCVSPEFARILDRMVSPHPARRYQTAEQVLADLDVLTASRAAQRAPLPARDRGWHSSGVAIALGGAVVLGIVAALNATTPLHRSRSAATPSPLPASNPAATAPLALSPEQLEKAKNQRFNQLSQALKQRDFQTADLETRQVLLLLAGARSRVDGTFYPDELRSLTCADLVLIDQLWSDASGGTLGFRAQKQTYDANGSDWRRTYIALNWLDANGDWLVNTTYNRQTQQWEYLPDGHPDFARPRTGHLPFVLRESSSHNLGRNTAFLKCF